MRPGELTWGKHDGDVMIIEPVVKDGQEVWRSKTPCSEVRAPLLVDFTLPEFAYMPLYRRF